MRYIHQRGGWPRFVWDEALLVSQLLEARYQQGALLGHMKTIRRDLSQDAALGAMTAEVVSTSEIEGEFLDPSEVRSSLSQRLGLGHSLGQTSDERIQGIVDIMVDATGHYGTPLTPRRLFSWHEKLFPPEVGKSQRITVGNWRRGPIYVVAGWSRRQILYEGPKANTVVSEMTAFLDWFNNETNIQPEIRSAITHLWFVSIHPFDDGNGHIGRAIGEMALAKGDDDSRRYYSLSAQILEERKQYYAILRQTTTGSMDITPWLSWFLGCLGRATECSGRMLATILRNANSWDTYPRESFNQRQQDMLEQLLNGFRGNLNVAKWQKMQKCDEDTAQQDIKGLVDRGVIEETADSFTHKNYEIPARRRTAAPLVPPQKTAPPPPHLRLPKAADTGLGR